MGNNTPQKIGDSFEEACKAAMQAVVKEWMALLRKEYEMPNWNPTPPHIEKQGAGYQNGFDLFIKVPMPSGVYLRLYMECKGAENYNTISTYELSSKIKQLAANRPRALLADAHLFAATSRAEHNPNDIPKIADQPGHPFPVVSWLAPKPKEYTATGPHDFQALFYTHELQQNPAVTAYKQDYLNKALTSTSASTPAPKPLAKVAVSLWQGLQAAINDYWNRPANQALATQVVNPKWWAPYATPPIPAAKKAKYYTRAQSAGVMKFVAVAQKFYVPNPKATRLVEDAISQSAKPLILCLQDHAGGGKSTFMVHLAHQFCQKGYPTYWLKNAQPGPVKDALEHRRKLSLGHSIPAILLLDNAAEHAHDLVTQAHDLTENYYGQNMVWIVADRSQRFSLLYNDLAHDIDEDQLKVLRHEKDTGFKKLIFEKFWGFLVQQHQLNPTRLKEEAWKEYQKKIPLNPATPKNTKTRSLSLVEGSIYVVRLLLNEKAILPSKYTYDWQDWYRHVSDYAQRPDTRIPHAKEARELYRVLAVFFQFGVRLSTTFALELLTMEQKATQRPPMQLTHEQLTLLTEETPTNPIIRHQAFDYHTQEERQELMLRHELLAQWFLEEEKDDEATTRYLSHWLSLATQNTFAKDMLLWLHRNQEFLDYPLLPDHLSEESIVDLLEKFCQTHPNELKARTELAKVYQQQKDFKKAEDVLLELLKLDNKNLQARTELAKVYQQLKDFKKAEDVLLESLQIDSKQLHPRTELAKVYQQLKDFKKAEDVLLESLQIDSKQLHPRTELAKVYQQLKDFKKAEDVLLESLQIDSKQLHPRTELAKVYQQLKDFKKAEDVLLESLQIDSKQLHPRTELAKVYQQLKDFKKAEDVLLELLKLDKKNLQARTELAKVYQQQKDFKKAEDVLHEALKINKNDLPTRTELAKVYQQLKDFKKAEDVLLELLKLDKKNLQARTELAKVYQQLKDFKKAEDVLLELLKLDNKNLQARTELAKVYQQLKDFKKAEDVLLELLKLDKKNLQARTELAKVYQQLKDFKKAIQYLQEYIELDPKGLHPRTELAKVYQQLKDFKKAIQYLQEYIELEPKGLHPRTELAKVYQQLKDFKKAEGVLHEALKINKNDLPTRTELAKVYQQLKDFKKAEDVLLELLKLDNKNLFGLDSMVRLYMKMGRDHLPKALPFLARALDVKPSNPHSLRNGYSLFDKLRQQHLAGKCAEALSQLKGRDKETRHWAEWQARTQGYRLYLKGTVTVNRGWPQTITDSQGQPHAAEKDPKKRCHHFGLANGQEVYFALGPNGLANFVEPHFSNRRQAIAQHLG